MIGRPSSNTPASSSIRGTRRRASVAPRTSSASKRLLLAAVLASLRPRQWVKNLFVFAGLIFSQKLFTPPAGMAVAAALVLVAAGLAASIAISPRLALVSLAYVTLMGAYSAWLKHLVIVDVIVVAAGFVLRAVAGALAIDVEISGWLLICTVLIALFFALGKRRHEVLTLAEGAARHRPILAEYSAGLLDQMIAVVTASTVTAYALYTMSPETVAKFDTHLLPATLPFVLYGIFRYLYLLYGCQMGGSPSELFLNDRPLLVDALLWMLSVVVLLYGPRVG